MIPALDLDFLFSKKLLLVTGKGGIGKTLLTAALGQAAASRGIATLLVESGATSQISPLFGKGSEFHEKAVIGPHLSTINLTPQGNFREYVTKYLGQQVLYDRVFSNKVVKSFINTIPGFAEVMLLGRLFYTCELAKDPRPDLVIFDGHASGHFLSLMTTPDAVLDTRLGGPVVRETERVRAFLADPHRCGMVYVCVPEELVVSETLDFLPRLARKAPARLMGVVANRFPRASAEGDSPARRFWALRHQRAISALATLEEGLKRLGGEPLPLWRTPELGFVTDPLPDEFGPRFLEGAAP